MMKICEVDVCTGCMVCQTICPKKAIGHSLDALGHPYPVVDSNLCIDCGMCKRVCPANNPTSKFTYPVPARSFACWNKDKQERKESASGGIIYLLSKKFVEMGGNFVGCEFSGMKAVHTLCNDKAQLHKYQGSKYVQSQLEPALTQIKQTLQAGEKILFVGTPCQVAAVKSYLGKNQKGLYTIDIVCNGVPSAQLLNDWVVYEEACFGKKLSDIRFRVKHPHHLRTAIEYHFTDGSNCRELLPECKYYLAFVYRYTVRNACIHCRYAKMERTGDITVSDFWNYKLKKIRFWSYVNGTSMVMANSARGEELMNMVLEDLQWEHRTVEDALRTNRSNLSDPQPRPNNYKDFCQLFANGKGWSAIPLNFFKPYPMPGITLRNRVKDILRVLMPEWLLCIKG